MAGNSLSPHFDVLIIGAGLAGLTTARQLLDDAKAQGVSPPSIAILEADLELGGRIRDARLSNGMKIDAGVTWVHGGAENPLLRDSIARYGTGLGPVDYDDATSRIWVTEGSRHGTDWKDVAVRELRDAYDQWKRDNPDEDIALSDLIGICMEKSGTVLTRAYGYYLATNWMGLDSMSHFSCDEYYTDPYGQGGGMLQKGMAHLVTCMVDELRKNAVFIQPGTTVKSLKNTADGIEARDVTGKTYTASRAVVTVSTGVLKSRLIAFDNDVNDKIDPYVASITMADMLKMSVPLRPGFLEDRGIKPDTFITVLNVDPMFLCHAGTGGKPLLTIHIGGKATTAFENLPQIHLDNCARAFLDRIPAISGYRNYVDGDTHVTGWASNPFTQGAYSCILPGHKRQNPMAAGNILFAGEAFAADTIMCPSQALAAWHSGRLAGSRIFEDLKTVGKLAAQPAVMPVAGAQIKFAPSAAI